MNNKQYSIIYLFGIILIGLFSFKSSTIQHQTIIPVETKTNNYPLGFLDGQLFSYGKTVKDTIQISLYSQANGSAVGKADLFLYKGVGSAHVIVPQRFKYENINRKSVDFFETGYQGEFHFMKYYDEQDGFIKVLNSDGSGYWLSLEEIDPYLFPVTFAEDIIEHQTWEIYGYDQYRLRSAPALDSEVILNLLESKHVIAHFTGKISDYWGEVLIYELETKLEGCYTEEELEKAKTGKEFKGWIRVVDENGQVADIDYHRAC